VIPYLAKLYARIEEVQRKTNNWKR